MRFIPLDWLPALHVFLGDRVARGRRAPARDALAVALGLHGMRVGEVCRALRQDLDLLDGRLHVRTLKGGRARSLRLHSSLAGALRSWAEGRPGGSLLSTSSGRAVFPSQFQRGCRQLTLEALGESFRFHALRHTFAMQVYSATRDLLLVKRLLGHRSVSATEVYADALAEIPVELLLDLGGVEECRFPAKPTVRQLRIFDAG